MTEKQEIRCPECGSVKYVHPCARQHSDEGKEYYCDRCRWHWFREEKVRDTGGDTA
jgi:predicted nucleic-acid-binding Zn-ribbon protein